MAQIRIDGILPKRSDLPLARLQVIDAAIEVTLRGQVKDILKGAMEARVKNWKTKPGFSGRFSRPTADVFSMYVFPRSTGGQPNGRQLWTWITQGTRARPIFARRAPMLSIREGYIPKTKKGAWYGGPGVYTGGVRYAPAAFKYPGIQARDFEADIKKETEDRIGNILVAAVQRVNP